MFYPYKSDHENLICYLAGSMSRILEIWRYNLHTFQYQERFPEKNYDVWFINGGDIQLSEPSKKKKIYL